MASTAKISIVFILAASLSALLSGCNSDDASAATPSAAAMSYAASMGARIDRGLSISGIPTLTIAAGAQYSFKPETTDATSTPLYFTIAGKPAWATFSATTGALAGSPAASSVGAYPNITISASDGTRTVELGPFTITVTAVAATTATSTTAPTGATTPPPANGTPATPPSATDVLAISGSPAATASVGTPYSFTPGVTDSPSEKLTFTIANKPAWASFDAATGALTGSPVVADVGVDAQIVISVTDGVKTAALPAFSIAVASPADSVTLTWTAPTLNSNGTPVTDLAGYTIYYGTSASSMTHTIIVNGATDTSRVIGSLDAGTWYFAVAAFNSDKVQSSLSAVLPVTI